ncbi:hypothetical protein KR018_000233 [Drosophila ironensis]|nr:hypothetical protein KR018_000233 [Drosophila ironensis]
MKFAIVLFALFAVAAARPSETQIIELKSDVQPDGYDFSLKTDDGTAKQESGHLINAGSENEAIAVKGSFSFVADDGQTYTVNYIADENGFQPQGAHLPVAPEA